MKRENTILFLDLKSDTPEIKKSLSCNYDCQRWSLVWSKAQRSTVRWSSRRSTEIRRWHPVPSRREGSWGKFLGHGKVLLMLDSFRPRSYYSVFIWKGIKGSNCSDTKMKMFEYANEYRCFWIRCVLNTPSFQCEHRKRRHLNSLVISNTFKAFWNTKFKYITKWKLHNDKFMMIKFSERCHWSLCLIRRLLTAFHSLVSLYSLRIHSIEGIIFFDCEKLILMILLMTFMLISLTMLMHNACKSFCLIDSST